MPVCQELPLCLFLKCEVKKTLLIKENIGRNTSIQIWGVSKAERGQNWTKPETRQELPWVDAPTVLFSWWNLNFPRKSHCWHSGDSHCCSHQDTVSQGWCDTGTGLVWHWDRGQTCSFSGYFSYPVSSALMFVSQFFWRRSRNSSLTLLPRVPRLVTCVLSSGGFCHT